MSEDNLPLAGDACCGHWAKGSSFGWKADSSFWGRSFLEIEVPVRVG
jgi:hypothetical protein